MGKNIRIENFLILGSGIKIFGHLLADEIAIWALIFKKITPEIFNKKKSQNSFNITSLILLALIINSFIALFIPGPERINSNAIEMFFLFTSLFILSHYKLYNQINFNHSYQASIFFILISLYFGVTEIFWGLISHKKCFTFNKIGEDCTYFTAYWQNEIFPGFPYVSWVGTAYAASILFLCNIIILRNRKYKLIKLYSTPIHFLIAILHHSRISTLFSSLISIKYLSLKYLKFNNLKIFFTAVITFTIIIYIILSFTTYLRFITIYYTSDFYNVVNNTIKDILSLNFHHLDDGRYAQIKGLYNYCIDNPIAAFFGNGTGSHKKNLLAYIPNDTSGLLRPVGIVAIVFDWGIFIWLLVTGVMIRNLIYSLKKIDCYINFLYYFLTPIFFYIMSFITNLNESIIFWIYILNLKKD